MNQLAERLSHQRAPLLAVALITLVYLATVLPGLGNDPIVGGDEGWIISASERLADDGVFGTGLFRGFYDAEDHYYFNLPLHHIVLAGAFKVIGSGITEARLISVVYGLATLLLTYALGRRLFSPWIGVGAAALLVFLRLNLAPFSGLTLTDLGATVRYDLIAVPYGLGALYLVARHLDDPSPKLVFVAGLLIGLGTLTQFLGAFFAIPIALFFLTLALPFACRALLIAVLGFGILLPLLPYGAYALSDWDDFQGQSRSVEQDTSYLTPSFYWRQLTNEPDRYATSTALESAPGAIGQLVDRPSARLTMLVLLPAAIVYTLLRGRRNPRYRLLGFVLVALIVQLALFESTKRFVYWVGVVPPLCIALADLAAAAWRWRPPDAMKRLLVHGAVGVTVALIAIEGLAVAAKDIRNAPDAPDYADLGRRLNEALPPGASALGDNRLWPLLRNRDYRSLILVFYHTNPEISRDRATDVFGAIERTQAEYILLSPLSREILEKLTPEDAADFDRFLADRTEHATTVPDRAYGPIDIYRVKP